MHPKELFPLIPSVNVNVNMTVPSTPRFYECLNSGIRGFPLVFSYIAHDILFWSMSAIRIVLYMHKEESVTSTPIDPYCGVDCQFIRIYVRFDGVCRDTFGAGIA